MGEAGDERSMIPKADTDDERLAAYRDVDFSYEDGTEALRGITLDIWRGEHIALVGGNGSGKTTLAKHLNGLLRPTSGKVFVRGKDTKAETVAALSKTVGYAFQNPDHQLFCSTVADEVSFGPKNIGFSEDEAVKKAERAIELMAIGHLRDRAPLSLGLGDRRRVSIAAVIAMDPDILVLDEPSAGLDAMESSALMRVIDGLNRDGKTVILITHEMRLVAEHSERVLVMSQGKITLDCRTRLAFTDLDVLTSSVLMPPAVARLAHMLREQGVSPEVLTVTELAKEIARIWGERP